MALPSVVTPGLKVQLFGAYCNNSGRSWNPDSGQPNVQDWFAGRQDFLLETGAPFLNGGNIFCGSSNAALKGNISNSMGLVNQVYSNPPYDYIPSIGCKLFQTGEISPATGRAYVWNDLQAYKDVANGLWDASWTGIVDAMVAKGRFIWFQRLAYEGNEGFMQDFSGYDNQSAQQTPWIAAMRHAFTVIRDYAATKGCYVLMGFNPSAATPGGPGVEHLFTAIGADVQNVVQFDCYNGYWGAPANQLPADTSGKVAGVGPSQANLIATWNTQNGGFGWSQCSTLALKLGMPIAIMECGSSGGDHHTLNDPFFYPWLASAIADHRAKGGTVLMCNVWSVPAGDGNTGVQFGSQPATLASLQSVVNTLVGDAFDPTAVLFGGKPPPANPPPPPPVTPPPPPPPPVTTMHPTSISTVVVPGGVLKGQQYAYVATATGGSWSAVGNVQYLMTIPANGNSTTGWVTPPAANVALDATGMIATISGLSSGITLPHTVQVRDKSFPSVVSPLVTYTITVAPVLHPLTIAYSDGSPTKVVQVIAGVTASYSVVQPDWPPQPPVPNETITVTFADPIVPPLVTTNPPGTTVSVSTTTVVSYSDSSAPVYVPTAAAATVSTDQPPQPPRVPQPPQTTTVTFSDPTLAQVVTTNAPGTTVTFS